MKVRDRDVLIEAFGLVHCQDHRLAAAARELRDELILRRDTGASIDQDDQPVRFADRPLGLRHHQTLDHVGVFNQTAGVDHDARYFGAPRETVLPIACEARQIGHQRIARACHGIEQSRLAHVWAADQCDYGQHASSGLLKAGAESRGGAAAARPAWARRSRAPRSRAPLQKKPEAVPAPPWQPELAVAPRSTLWEWRGTQPASRRRSAPRRYRHRPREDSIRAVSWQRVLLPRARRYFYRASADSPGNPPARWRC